MKKLEKITNRIEANKELNKTISNMSYYDTKDFIRDANDYIKAIKEGRMINSIGSVSKSGMSRTMKFLSCNGSKGRFSYRQYSCLFEALGYKTSRESDYYFRVNGCGMDMVFHTNYTNIHNLHSLGFINKKECACLAQQTPTTI